MGAMNTALLTKWWWRFFNETQLPWRRLITSLYYTRRRPLHEGRAFTPYSQWWRSVMTCRDVFKTGVSYTLGDGRNIRLWSDIWIEENPLSTQFPGIYSTIINKEVTISQCWNDQGWRWRFIVRSLDRTNNNESRRQKRLLKNLLSQYWPSGTSDKIKWKWTTNQTYTVKSLYDFITDGGQIDPTFDQLWRIRIPAKNKIFIWILLRKRLLTADRLIRRGCAVDQYCSFCAIGSETCDHLFRECVFVRYLLVCARILDRSELELGGVRGLWTETVSIHNVVVRTKRLTQVAAIWWVIWTERNNTIFNGARFNVSRALQRVTSLTNDWTEIG